ncbi:WXG100 family type VII secretion target [Actinoalloteichus spitiensis]|uniref:WXG100 family type VII secretion target n=1 Tax=Actinoalloteichus spitiensis TaxID=252394 RepID=UPI00036EEA27|nr:WXG100 family type VII secretion target [Actinoalloteichus spitiensis]
MSDNINYVYPKIAEGINIMRNSARGIQASVDGLRSDTQRQLASFDGEAANAYGSKSSLVTQAFASANNTLNNAATAIESAADNLQRQDRASAGGF